MDFKNMKNTTKSLNLLKQVIFLGQFFCPTLTYILPPPTYLPFSHRYLVNLHLGLTYKLLFKPPIYPPYLATLYFSLAKSLSLNKTFIYFWLNLYLLTKKLFFGVNLYILVKPLFLLDKIVIYCWLKFCTFAEPISYLFLAKLLFLNKIFIYL
jgi:hypothetical protein